jgi:hypothetical protein
MIAPAQPLQPQPDIARGADTLVRNAFALWAGPLAWFIQFCAGYWLASWPCFPHDHRLAVPVAKASWSMDAMVALLILGVLIALAGALLSWRTFAATRAETRADAARTWIGRACFFALWGLVWNLGFAATTLATAVGFIALPRCGG